MRAVLSTGSNMEDSRAHLASVVDEFADELVAASSIYATAPWGGVEQPDFLNQILVVDVDETPLELLDRCQKLEEAADRVRDVRWGPRTLDVDIVALFAGPEPADQEPTGPVPAGSEQAGSEAAGPVPAGPEPAAAGEWTRKRGVREITVDTERLTVPHPRAHQRAFVLLPWLEVEGDAVVGGVGVDKLVAQLPPAEVEGVARA